jgi:predicted transcriptional regulator
MSKAQDFNIIKLIVQEPRSLTDLIEATGEYEERIRGTLRELQAAQLITPCGQRQGPMGRPRILYRWAA